MDGSDASAAADNIGTTFKITHKIIRSNIHFIN